MTVEVLAEEWLDKERNLIIEDFLTQEEDYFLSNIFKKIKRAYINGYHKCQKKRWHDLRKDKNDLPKLDKTDMSDYVITDKGVGYYNGRVKSWYIQNEYILTDDIIAWCELPQFKESE